MATIEPRGRGRWTEADAAAANRREEEEDVEEDDEEEEKVEEEEEEDEVLVEGTARDANTVGANPDTEEAPRSSNDRSRPRRTILLFGLLA
jgi:hypothetical protein